jgi:hypothetical protein
VRCLLAFIAAIVAPAQPVFSDFRDHPAIAYSTHPPRDPVAKLNQKLREGEAVLKFDGPSGYLRSVLDALQIPVESQIAVFSKTSLQAPIISPTNPRTIFFNDSVSAAWVRGEPFVEVASQDPDQGVIFYVLEQKPSERPQFRRSDGACLSCHENYSTMGVPGTLLRSVYPAVTGQPYRRMGDRASDHRTPFAERWGGWYLTGGLGGIEHLGNTVFFDPDNPSSRRSILVKIDPSIYLSPYSDVAALLVFEHQMHMINLLTRIAWECRYSAYENKPFDAASAAKELVDYMLFAGEAKLPGKLTGTSGFAEKFASQEPRDRQGRSLRHLDLESRLMRYPCSYMIYSDAFNALPPAAKTAVYQRLQQLLMGQEPSHLSAVDRHAIIEIIRDTKPELREYLH